MDEKKKVEIKALFTEDGCIHTEVAGKGGEVIKCFAALVTTLAGEGGAPEELMVSAFVHGMAKAEAERRKSYES